MSDSRPSGAEAAQQSMRLDKWLWAARFFKTRQLAIDAINGGKVHLDGRHTKPGRTVAPGNRISIRKANLEWEIEVLALSRQRRPAPEAQQLYRESPASLERRQQQLQQRKLEGDRFSRKPNKKERRHIHRFLDSMDS